MSPLVKAAPENPRLAAPARAPHLTGSRKSSGSKASTPRRITFAHAKLSAILIAVFAVPAGFGQTSPQACDQLSKFKIAGAVIAIAKTEVKPAVGNVPPYCRVDATIDPRTGVGGKPYGIGFAVALPANWNGGFLFQGGGGLNGNVANPLGAQAAGDTPALARGFAVVTTDSGHKGAVFDGSFMQDQQAALDFAYIAVGRVTQVAKQIAPNTTDAPRGIPISMAAPPAGAKLCSSRSAIRITSTA